MTAQRLLIVGALLAAAALLLVVVAPADTLRGWLAAAFLWSGLPFGSMRPGTKAIGFNCSYQ